MSIYFSLCKAKVQKYEPIFLFLLFKIVYCFFLLLQFDLTEVPLLLQSLSLYQFPELWILQFHFKGTAKTIIISFKIKHSIKYKILVSFHCAHVLAICKSKNKTYIAHEEKVDEDKQSQIYFDIDIDV